MFLPTFLLRIRPKQAMYLDVGSGGIRIFCQPIRLQTER